MGVLRAMLQWIRRSPPQPPGASCIYVPPSPELREREAWMEQALDRAGTANDRAALGFVATTGQAMKQESRIQAMLRGVLEEVDRDVDRG